MPQFDVFLSHSSVDKPWVIKLKGDLLRYGVSVWLDKDEIRPGDIVVDVLEQALDNCRAIALIVSPASISSGWVKEEYSRALSIAKTKQPSIPIIPVILQEAKLPGFLKSRNWVDFRDETAYAERVRELVWGITGEKPAEILDLEDSQVKCELGGDRAPSLDRSEIIQDYSDKIVLLMGAGVSNFLGLPTLDDVLQQTVVGNDEVAIRINNTRNAIEAYTARVEARFEELISRLRYYLDVAELLRKDNTFRNELGQLPSGVDNGDFQRKWRLALTKCYRIILKEYGPQKINKDGKECKAILSLLGELAGINSDRLHIFTTNYDCSFQVLASICQNLDFFTHIDNSNGSFMDRWYRANPALKGSNLPSIYIHRFHGCVGWFGKSNKPFGVEEVYGVGGDLEINDDEMLHRMHIKLTSSQSIGTSPAFALAFEEFQARLAKAKILLVWGYSFRDIEVLRYINQAFSQKSQLSILYIDPYLSEGQVCQYIRSTMGEAPIAIHPNFLPVRVDWRPTDGCDKLVETVVQAVSKTLTI